MHALHVWCNTTHNLKKYAKILYAWKNIKCSVNIKPISVWGLWEGRAGWSKNSSYYHNYFGGPLELSIVKTQKVWVFVTWVQSLSTVNKPTFERYLPQCVKLHRRWKVGEDTPDWQSVSFLQNQAMTRCFKFWKAPWQRWKSVKK